MNKRIEVTIIETEQLPYCVRLGNILVNVRRDERG